MTIKTMTTKSGKIVEVELVRAVNDKIAYADGWNIPVGREIIERTTITLRDQSGKKLAAGNSVSPLQPKIFRTDAEMQERGAVGQIGNAYIPQEIVDLINAALAELEAENPKSDEQIAIERHEAERLARVESERDAIYAAAELERRMDDPNSDF